jgi:two-component system, OmpR family, KDP operon response regulator KdpE
VFFVNGTSAVVRVLVIDDELSMRRVLRVSLEQHGCTVLLAASGEEGLKTAAAQPPDMVILDLAMPGIDGLEVCRRLREQSRVPIIVLSVCKGDRDKVTALDLGADDYVTKPFSLDELLARMRAVHRRVDSGEEPSPPSLVVGDLQIDFVRRSVTQAGTDVHLTPIEFDLLRVLVANAGLVVTHRQLLTSVWGPAYAEDIHTLQVHVANLRRKIELDAARTRYLHTEPRIGYRFQAACELPSILRQS